MSSLQHVYLQKIEQLSNTLMTHGITCCLMDVPALAFYGAERLRIDWEVCVPTALFHKAQSLLSTPDFSDIYQKAGLAPSVQPASLIHLCPRFNFSGTDEYFVLIPAQYMHFECISQNIIYDSKGCPYPRLPALMQTYLDTNNIVNLTDLIDGSDVSEEWGNTQLLLHGTNDVVWASEMNATLLGTGDATLFPSIMYAACPTRTIDKGELWQSCVRGKKQRLGWTRPESMFATRFRLKNSPNPWQIQ